MRWSCVVALLGVIGAGCDGENADAAPPDDPRCLVSQRLGAQGVELAVDASGNSFIGVTFQGSLDLGGATYRSAGGSRDLLLAKVDARGRVVWARHLGDSSDQRFADIAATPDGGVLLTGNLRGSIDLGGGPLRARQRALFLARLDASGRHVWSRSFESDEEPVHDVNAVSATPDGGALLFGTLEGRLDFGGLTVRNGGIFPYLVRFDARGAPSWGKGFTGSVDQTPLAVGADREGNVYIAEEAKWSIIEGVTLRGDAFANTLAASFTPAGALRWAKIIRERPASGPTGEPDTFPTAMAVDPRGGMLLAGTFGGTLDLGAGPISAGGPGEYGSFVARLDRNGRAQWSRAVPGAQIASVDVDRAGDALITGSFTGTIDLGGAPLSSAGGADVLVAGLARGDGRALWSERYGDAADQRGVAVAAGPGGRAWVTGAFAGSLDLGCGDGALTTSGSAEDLFLAEIMR